MPANYRDAVIQGVQAATSLHEKLGLRKTWKNNGCIDVFKAIGDQDYVLLFRPLKGLLGLSMQEPMPGVLVTTQRPLSIQRYTAAHELGHLEMGHDFSLDTEKNINSPWGKTRAELQEVSANIFGAEFLMPRWFLTQEMNRHSWKGKDLEDPMIIYQMSLRLGTSYEALIRTLNRYNWTNL